MLTLRCNGEKVSFKLRNLDSFSDPIFSASDRYAGHIDLVTRAKFYSALTYTFTKFIGVNRFWGTNYPFQKLFHYLFIFKTLSCCCNK